MEEPRQCRPHRARARGHTLGEKRRIRALAHPRLGTYGSGAGGRLPGRLGTGQGPGGARARVGARSGRRPDIIGAAVDLSPRRSPPCR